ncbi:hypothetical protein [Nonomuraea dietziae]|uniref:hypothetical protein n=1 Tax=Nonomuraea dietziae TaxID=65515 RepID=UPI00341D37C5
MTLAARAIADLRWVAAYWPDLHDSRLHGTPAAFRRVQLTAEQLDERDAAAWIERLERTPEAIGASPAPVRVPVVDLLTGLLADTAYLADELAAALSCPTLEPPASGLADARPYLTFAMRRLGEPAVDDALAAWAYGRTRALVSTVARGLALIYDGQALEIECPWCRGVTPETPAGGAWTWKVRDLLGGRACRHGLPDRRFCVDCEQQVVIVCENDCEPPSKAVGTWWHGFPCWRVYEWDWLAEQVRRAATPTARLEPLRDDEQTASYGGRA